MTIEGEALELSYMADGVSVEGNGALSESVDF